MTDVFTFSNIGNDLNDQIETDEIKIDHLIRSRRRSIALEINKQGELIVRAPLGVSRSAVEQLIEEKRNWIKKKQEGMLEKLDKIQPKEFVDGEKFLYLGEYYELMLVEDLHCHFFFNNDNFLLCRKYHKYADEVVTNWYKDQAFEVMKKRVDYFAELTNLTYYNKVRMSNAKKRWGSCSGRNVLSFSWRLIMAPIEVIDYVVVHELMHMLERNHSRHFWDKVGQVLPDYKVQQKWLKENGIMLDL